MSDSGSSDGGRGDGGRSSGRRQDDKEVDSKTVIIQSKRFYLDVKENWRGRYIKIAEVATGNMQGMRRKSRVLFSMPAAVEFMNKLDEYIKLSKEAKGGEKKANSDTIVIKEDKMTEEDRNYTFELCENQRGKFLRVVMQSTTAQYGAPRGVRPSVAIPAGGLSDMRDELKGLLDKWNKDLPPDTSYKGPMPQQSSMRVNNKTFYFDYGQNARGVFMRISEVKPQWRTAITIPRSEWHKVMEILKNADETVKDDKK